MGFNSGFKGLNSSTCFEHYPAHLQEVHVIIVYFVILLGVSLSVFSSFCHTCHADCSIYLRRTI